MKTPYFSSMENNLGIGSKVEHPHFGKGIVVETAQEFYTIWFKTQAATKTVSKDYKELRVLNALAENESENNAAVSLTTIEEAIERVLDRRLNEFQLVPMANKWNNGTLVLKPGDESLQEKEIPIETFFHKIVMVRDRLRLIEQKINSSKTLTDEEKIDWQQYVTGIYGSLTTFNILFKESHHQFKGNSNS